MSSKRFLKRLECHFTGFLRQSSRLRYETADLEPDTQHDQLPDR